ncbi:MAG TPA: diacylglycerol kinase [Bacteroidetes bacterium]|nr:diacylglycerol kinase [Bacteroidota bacterium]
MVLEKINKVAFVVNPKAGSTKNKQGIIKQIKQEIPSGWEHNIYLWNHPDEIESIVKKVVDEGVGLIVAVGGDGTVNEIARRITGTEVALAIIPIGSGNGLARHLGIPLKAKEAAKLLSTGKIIAIDSCRINDKYFFCTAGVGFDAHIGKMFATSETRGFWTYLKITLKEFSRYKPQRYHLVVDEKPLEVNAFLTTFANAGQYGNNAYIAPEADVQDGLVHVVVLKPFSPIQILNLGARLFNKSIHQSKYLETYTGKSIVLERSSAGPIHCDGEPFEMGKRMEVKVFPKSLLVLVP